MSRTRVGGARRLGTGLQQGLLDGLRPVELPQVDVRDDRQAAPHLVPLAVPVPLQHRLRPCRLLPALAPPCSCIWNTTSESGAKHGHIAGPPARLLPSSCPCPALQLHWHQTLSDPPARRLIALERCRCADCNLPALARPQLRLHLQTSDMYTSYPSPTEAPPAPVAFFLPLSRPASCTKNRILEPSANLSDAAAPPTRLSPSSRPCPVPALALASGPFRDSCYTPDHAGMLPLCRWRSSCPCPAPQLRLQSHNLYFPSGYPVPMQHSLYACCLPPAFASYSSCACSKGSWNDMSFCCIVPSTLSCIQMDIFFGKAPKCSKRACVSSASLSLK